MKKSLINKSFEIISKIVPFSLSRNILKRKVFIQTYHVVSDEESIHTKYLYTHRGPSQFRKDLEFFLKNYIPVSLSEFLEKLNNGQEFKKNSFMIQFDDGLREAYETAMPILLEMGVPATFFINTDMVDNKNIFLNFKLSIIVDKCLKLKNLNDIKKIFDKHKLNFADIKRSILTLKKNQIHVINELVELIEIDFENYLKQIKPFMTTQEISDLLAKGFSIGSHSIDHPNYHEITLEEQLSQTLESIKYLRQKFSLDYGVFAFPYNNDVISDNFFETIYKSGLINATFGGWDVFGRNFERFDMGSNYLSTKSIIKIGYLKSFINNNFLR